MLDITIRLEATETVYAAPLLSTGVATEAVSDSDFQPSVRAGRRRGGTVNRSRAVPLLIAVLALSTLAIAATTLETTVTTDPDEEIDPNWERLPLSEQDAAAIQSEMAAQTAGGSADERTGANGGETASSGAALVTPPEESLLDRLLAFLGTIIGVVLGGAIVAGVIALAYRYRGQYDSLFDPEQPTSQPTEPPTDRSEWPAAEPAHVVDQAWVRVVTELEPAHPETTTPTECVALARRTDLDVAAVEAITAAFERVHYGGGTLAEESSRARDGLDRLTGGQQ